MRILQISNGVYPEGNAGVEIYTDALSQALVAIGHEVHIAIPTNNPPPANTKYVVHALPASMGWPYGIDPSRSHVARVIASLRDVVLAVNPDLVHVQHLIQLGWPVLRFLERQGIPYTLALWDYWLLCPGIKRLCKGSLRACTTRCLNVPISRPHSVATTYIGLRARRKQVVQLLNSITAPVLPCSYSTAKVFEKYGVERTRMLVNHGSVTPFSKCSSENKTTGVHTIRFAFIGRLAPEKGVDTLLRAFSLIDRDAQLRIYGDGPIRCAPEMSAFQNLPNIQFMGKYDNSTIPSILASVDAVVVPSNWEEPYGLVVQEALTAEKPTIVADVAGLAEQIVHGLNGFVFAPGDEASLTFWMRHVVDNYPSIRNGLAYEFNRRWIDQDGKHLSNLFDAIRTDWRRLKDRFVTALELGFDRESEAIASATNMDLKEVRATLHREVIAPGSVVASEWGAARPVTDTQIMEFYRTTDSYLYDLCVVHQTGERKAWRRLALSVLKAFGVNRLLDYGGGCGIDSVAFAEAGFSCDLYDLGDKNKEFARRWAQIHGVHVGVLGEVPKAPEYDAVYSTELLEHVPSPFDEVRSMAKCLRPCGILLLTHSFDLLGDAYPQHLKRHRGLDAKFVEEVENLGLELERTIAVPGNRFYIFRLRRVEPNDSADCEETSSVAIRCFGQ